jgi:hypothetical protein
MTAKHTPGPWVRRNIASARDIYIAEANDGGAPSVAIVPTRVSRLADEEDANARLIAAAPDLLAALRRIVASDDAHATLHAPDDDDIARMVEYAAAFDNARAAIAKATGEAA